MRYLSVCSGIEAATVAWHPLGWEPAAFSDIEAFPRAVLRHHYPDVPLHGRERARGESLADYASHAGFQTIEGNEYGTIDLLVGGTPCQSFSIAGLRGGLADERGNLALEYLRLARRSRARWLVWENVPGVLSSGGGRDFGAILGGMAELGYGFAYAIRDAQFFGVPQRRRRVFVVGYLGDWRRAAAVLFERHGMRGLSWPPRATPVSVCLTARGAGSLDDRETYIVEKTGVRHLIPRECERLQGFPDEYTRIPWRGRTAANCPDGPRYKALGNSMAVPVMRWIGERIASVEAMGLDERAAA